MHAAVIAASSVVKTVPRSPGLSWQVNVPKQLAGPLQRHAVVGELTVLQGRHVVARVRLLLAQKLPAVSPLTKAARFLTRPFTLVLLVVLLLAGLGVVGAWRSRATGKRSGWTEGSMIITVTLNAALDKTLEVPNFTPGRRHRTVDQTTMAGGKGVNVARAIKRLGQPVIATGLAGGSTGNRIVDALNGESILNGFVRIREESRTNTAVLDPTTGLHTEVNERGPAVSAHELELFHEKLLYLAKGASICVFSGSLPRGIEPDVYTGLIREVRKLGVTTMLDTEGEPLRLAMRGRAGRRDAERARGRGARRPRVQRRRQTAPMPSRRSRGSGPWRRS